MNDDSLLVYRGGECKALGSGRVGGRLIVFDSVDKVGDQFSIDCDFDLEDGRGRRTVLYEHGQHPEVKNTKLGRADIELHLDGLHIEAILTLKDSISRAIYEDVEKGELAWSSGSAPHLVRRTRLSATKSLIRSWFIVEASLTRTPCDPMAVATALKSFTAHCNFKLLTNHDLERRAAAMHAQLLRWQHEARMREFEKSLHGDDASEMAAYYSAMAQLNAWRVRQNK